MIRKVHRKCMMKGCRSTTSYHISLSREIGNSIIICRDCAQKALKMIDEFEKRSMPSAAEEASDDTQETAEIADDVQEKAEIADGDGGAVSTEQSEGEVCKCPECGKKFSSEKGLAAHMRIHKE